MKKLPLLLLLIGTCLVVSCTKKKEVIPVKAVPVKIARAKTKKVPYYIATVGHIKPYQSVEIQAQVDGILIKTYFEDGAEVKKGDPLYLIDQSPYLTRLQQTQGELEESLAKRAYARRTTERNSQLVQDEYISQDNYDSLITQALVDEGLVKQKEAQVENAQIDLNYTTIFSPLDGRAGFRLVDDGNLILKSEKTTLVTLNQISPIYATFFITGKDLPKVQRYRQRYGELTTLVTVSDPEAPIYKGQLTAINNAIDQATGMIEIEATFENRDKTLWPNQYVQIKLILDTIEKAVLVPLEAIQNSAKGKWVFVIRGNKTAQKRMVTTAQIQEDNLIVIKKGLYAGEKVVTEGQINLYDQAPVTIIGNSEDN